MQLLKNVHVFSPGDLGINDILIAGGKFERIQSHIDISEEYVDIIDGTGKYAVPGFIDPHVHITGGGGEGGTHTRAPEIVLSTFIEAGITTVIGLLGTDGITRSPENLFAKAKALREEGISVYALTGSYHYPAHTLTGEVQKDIVFIEECIGAKIAVSDHRSSCVTDNDLARLASDVRVAGMIAKKSGVLTIHIGGGKDGLNMINRVIEKTDLPITVMRPTHVNRSIKLLMQSFEFIRAGGYIDLTCGIYKHLPPHKVISMAKQSAVPLNRITFSSDGGGSWSTYDEDGNLTKIGISTVSSLHQELKNLVLEEGFDLSEALPFLTLNTAQSLGLSNKGRIEQGADADLVLLDKSLNIETVMAGAQFYLREYNCIARGTFE